MFSKFLSRVKALPPRSSDWVNRLGPVALMGYGAGAAQSSDKLLGYFYKDSRDCDLYAELTFHEPGPVECPPETVIFLPVIKCGSMLEDNAVHAGVTADEWYLGMTEAATDLTEKGYVPVSVGGDGSATLAMVESYKRLFPNDDVVLLHFSAYPRLSRPTDPIRVLLDKDLLKGVVSIGNRSVSSDDRRVRKLNKMFYMDMHAIFAKGLFCVQDLRNDYPVFISIDASALDPAFAPGVDLPIPGGFSTRELLHIMSGIRGPRVIGVDIHGYNPDMDLCRGDGVGLTQITLSKVLKESILKCFSISSVTREEGMDRVKAMQREGTLAQNLYPDH